MKPIKNFNDVKPYTDAEKLPAGAYIVKLMKGARVESNQYGEVLLVPFDICEGEYTGFYTAQFQNSQMEDKKYKGVYRMNIPKEDGTEKDGWTMRRFKTDILAIEDSNNGWHWDWNEAGLAGKVVGMLFQNKEWEFNGSTGWTAQPHSLRAVQDIRDGKFKLPADKPLANKKTDISITPSLDDFSDIASDDGDLPF